jgi:hypothetical protein
MYKDHLAPRDEGQEEQFERWETPETRAAREAWRPDPSLSDREPASGSSSSVLEWAVKQAPSVLRDMVVASLVQQLQELRNVVLAQQSNSASQVAYPPLADHAIRSAVAAGKAAASSAFGDSFVGYDFATKFDPDLGGNYVSVTLRIRQISDLATFEDAQARFYAVLQSLLLSDVAERAVFSILDSASE